MLLQTNSYIVPKDRRAEHTRLLRRFRQTLGRLGCDMFEVYEQLGANWSTGEMTGRFVQIMRFRDRKHQRAVHAAEQSDAAAQQLIADFCDLINLPYQQQQGLLAVGYYKSVVDPSFRQAAAEAEAVGEGFAEPVATAADLEGIESVVGSPLDLDAPEEQPHDDEAVVEQVLAEAEEAEAVHEEAVAEEPAQEALAYEEPVEAAHGEPDPAEAVAEPVAEEYLEFEAEAPAAEPEAYEAAAVEEQVSAEAPAYEEAPAVEAYAEEPPAEAFEPEPVFEQAPAAIEPEPVFEEPVVAPPVVPPPVADTNRRPSATRRPAAPAAQTPPPPAAPPPPAPPQPTRPSSASRRTPPAEVAPVAEVVPEPLTSADTHLLPAAETPPTPPAPSQAEIDADQAEFQRFLREEAARAERRKAKAKAARAKARADAAAVAAAAPPPAPSLVEPIALADAPSEVATEEQVLSEPTYAEPATAVPIEVAQWDEPIAVAADEPAPVELAAPAATYAADEPIAIERDVEPIRLDALTEEFAAAGETSGPEASAPVDDVAPADEVAPEWAATPADEATPVEDVAVADDLPPLELVRSDAAVAEDGTTIDGSSDVALGEGLEFEDEPVAVEADAAPADRAESELVAADVGLDNAVAAEEARVAESEPVEPLPVEMESAQPADVAEPVEPARAEVPVIDDGFEPEPLPDWVTAADPALTAAQIPVSEVVESPESEVSAEEEVAPQAAVADPSAEAGEDAALWDGLLESDDGASAATPAVREARDDERAAAEAVADEEVGVEETSSLDYESLPARLMADEGEIEILFETVPSDLVDELAYANGHAVAEDEIEAALTEALGEDGGVKAGGRR